MEIIIKLKGTTTEKGRQSIKQFLQTILDHSHDMNLIKEIK